MSGLEPCYVLVSHIAHIKGNDHMTAYWATQQGAIITKNYHFPHSFQISAMVLLISPKRIELESCACAQIEAIEEGNM